MTNPPSENTGPMSNRIPDDMLNAAGFGGSNEPPAAAPRVRVDVHGPNGQVEALEGHAALVGVLLGSSGGDQTAGAQWFANVDHMTSAFILANLIAMVRMQFGQRAIDAALELSLTTQTRLMKPNDGDATGGP